MPPRIVPLRQTQRRILPSLRRSFHPDRTIQEYDVLLLKQSNPRSAKWRFTPPLRLPSPPIEGTSKGTANPIKLAHGATIAHEDLIGKKYLDVVRDSTGRECTIYEGSMASHVQSMERAATPIYPHDAQTIVNMMDLHFDPADDTSEPFEVFEAGTGAGSLTIHIARALHAANPPLPKDLRQALPKAGLQIQRAKTVSSSEAPEETEAPGEKAAGAEEAVKVPEGGNISHVTFHDAALTALAKEYVQSRKAVLHTLDHKPNHTSTAASLIRRFRRGLYLPHVDFHVGTLSSYLAPRLASRNQRPFLSRAVLDLPAPETEADVLIPCLHPNATLIVFAPSISQVGDFIKWSTRTKQELRLDRVAELVTSSSGEFGVGENEGGRSWRVKTVVPKDQRPGRRSDGAQGRHNGEEEEEGRQPELVQVMRPKVGEKICGGGFVAVLRKTRGGREAEVPEVVEVAEEEDGGLEEEGSDDRPGK